MQRPTYSVRRRSDSCKRRARRTSPFCTRTSAVIPISDSWPVAWMWQRPAAMPSQQQQASKGGSWLVPIRPGPLGELHQFGVRQIAISPPIRVPGRRLRFVRSERPQRQANPGDASATCITRRRPCRPRPGWVTMRAPPLAEGADDASVRVQPPSEFSGSEGALREIEDDDVGLHRKHLGHAQEGGPGHFRCGRRARDRRPAGPRGYRGP